MSPIGAWTPDALPHLRGFHARISRLDTWKNVAREVDTFVEALQNAEGLVKVCSAPSTDAHPPELVRAMVELQRTLEELHAAVRERRLFLNEEGRYETVEVSSSAKRRSTIHSALNGI